MRKFIYNGLTVLGVALTIASAIYAYDDRGYFAVGGEYGFLLLPLFGMVVEDRVTDWLEGRHQ